MLLQRPTLAADIASGRFFVEGSAGSIDGRSLSIAALFPEERLRAEATDAVRTVEQALAVLEEFIDTPFPTGTIRLWYGFKVGNSGGGGQLFMENKSSYDSRTPATRLWYEATLTHELSHSYIANESLTQFLELYVYNVIQNASWVVSAWTFTRNYVPFAEGNQDASALLDVYQWIGRDAMARAYKTVVPLRPPYGSPLSAACRELFVDQAPEAVKVQVAERIGRITF